MQLASSDPKAVAGWLLENTGIDVDMPPADSPGRHLIGARRCSIGGKPAAFAMFRLRGVPASVVATPAGGIDLSRMMRVEHAGRAHGGERGRGSVGVRKGSERRADDLGMKNLHLVANRVRNDSDQAFIREMAGDLPVLGFLPYDPQVIEADLTGQAVYDLAPETVAAAREIWDKLTRSGE